MLDKARLARNRIAHEVATLGYLGSVQKQDISEQLARLRAAVSELAAGDNVVSTWIHAIDEWKESRPRSLIEIYPDLVERWVFGHFDATLLTELDTPEEPQVSLTARAHAWHATRQQEKHQNH